jgi:predicted transcriptional regulator
MSANTPVPSVSELTLLKALWKQQPLSAREIHDAAGGELAWSFSSTRKTLDRMLEKHMVSLQIVHGINVYSAQLDKVGTLAAFAHDFGRRVMEMDAPLPVTMFTGSKLVDQQELAQLEQMLLDWPDDEAPEPPGAR